MIKVARLPVALVSFCSLVGLGYCLHSWLCISSVAVIRAADADVYAKSGVFICRSSDGVRCAEVSSFPNAIVAFGKKVIGVRRCADTSCEGMVPLLAEGVPDLAYVYKIGHLYSDAIAPGWTSGEFCPDCTGRIAFKYLSEKRIDSSIEANMAGLIAEADVFVPRLNGTVYNIMKDVHSGVRLIHDVEVDLSSVGRLHLDFLKKYTEDYFYYEAMGRRRSADDPLPGA